MSVGLKTKLQPVAEDLQRIFGDRLEAMVGYGWHPQDRVPSMALVKSLTLDDLTTCGARTSHWHRAGCATPLLLTAHEFARSLDAFPIEYGEILATSELIVGSLPFDALAISREDMRRACEVQVKSHLLHLREDFLEGGGRPANVAALVRDSAPAFGALLRHMARLDNASITTDGELIAYSERRIGLDPRVVGDLLLLTEPDTMATVDAGRVFPAYLATVERLADFVDTWRHSS
jgi:hypothetical protein